MKGMPEVMAHATRPEHSAPPQTRLRQMLLAAPVGVRLAPLLPPLLLVLLTLIALSIAYSVRPRVQVDLGSYYDSIYLRDFHARELDAAAAPRVYAWQPDPAGMVLPGGYNSDILITIEASPDLPERPLGLVALNVNDTPVSIPRSSSHRFTAFVPAAEAAAPELHLKLRPALTGGQEPDPTVVQQVVVAPARTYRWTQDQSAMVFPGLGRGAWHVELDVVTAHPDGISPAARITANGVPLATLPDSGELRHVSLLVPASLMSSGDLELAVQSRTYTDPRPLGVFIADVSVTPITSTGTLLPPLRSLVAGVGVALGLYTCLAILLGGVAPQQPRRTRWGAASVALLAVLLLAFALMQVRFPISFMAPHLAWLAVWSVLLLLLLRPLVLRFSPTPRYGYALLLLFFASYWLKVAGMLYPYFIAIDVHWHMERVRWILQGQLPLLYGTNSPLNESTMPVAEWGTNRPVIPYSPWFHMLAAGFSVFPWRLEFTNNMFSALVDTSRILMLGLVAVRVGMGQRGGLLAAALLAVLPVNFLLHSWGNAPTTTGFWWSLAATLWVVVGWERLHERMPFIVLTLLLLGAFLIYTVAGVLTGLFLVLLTPLVWLAAGRSQQPHLRRGLRPLWLATALAALLAIGIYYFQYIPPIIERTLPYFLEAFAGDGHADSGKATDTVGDYLLRHARLTSYGIVLPLLLGLVYLGWGWRSRFTLHEPTTAPHATPPAAVILWAAVGGWAGVMLLFVPLAYVISMVDKHFFVALPLLVLATGAVLARLWQQGWWARLLILLYYAYLFVAALNLWLTRILTVKQG